VTLDHPIFTRWPAQYAEWLQLFSAPTPNGVKVGIMLEETSLADEPHRIDIMADGAVWIPKDFHMAMAVAAGRLRSRHARWCSLSSRDPTSTSSRETDPFGVR